MSNPFEGMKGSLSDHHTPRGRQRTPIGSGWGFTAGAALFILVGITFLIVGIFRSAFIYVGGLFAVLGLVWSMIASGRERNGLSIACLVLSLLLVCAVGGLFVLDMVDAKQAFEQRQEYQRWQEQEKPRWEKDLLPPK